MVAMIKTLEDAARQCGELLIAKRGGRLTATNKVEKLGAHFSTDADNASQRLGKRILRKAFPHEIIVAEEGKQKKVISANCTLFDPLDGTTIYFNGFDEFGVTICVMRRGRPVVGVMYFPVIDEMISAQRGKGCFINGVRINRIRTVSPRNRDKAVMGSDVGPWTIDEVLNPLRKQWTVVSKMAAIWGARSVLMGQTQGYWNLNIAKVWDAAAGALAVTEAGGVALNPWGNDITWKQVDCDWVLATNNYWANRVIARTKKWPGRN